MHIEKGGLVYGAGYMGWPVSLGDLLVVWEGEKGEKDKEIHKMWRIEDESKPQTRKVRYLTKDESKKGFCSNK